MLIQERGTKFEQLILNFFKIQGIKKTIFTKLVGMQAYPLPF